MVRRLIPRAAPQADWKARPPDRIQVSTRDFAQPCPSIRPQAYDRVVCSVAAPVV